MPRKVINVEIDERVWNEFREISGGRNRGR